MSKLALSYQSVRFIRIDNTKLAIMYYTLMVAILTYVIVVPILHDKGYQKFENLIGAVSVKTKGAVEDTNSSIYDSYDLILPATEEGAFFLTTALIHTNQTRGFCKSEQKCTSDSDCQTGNYGNFTEHGRLTRSCLDGYCEIEAWCPVEVEDEDKLVRINSYLGLWTVFVKANIHFPANNIRLSNAMTKILPGINLFTIDEILEKAGTTYHDIVDEGTVIICEIKYDCNLDHNIDKCQPTLTFDRVDIRGFSTGFNYRFRKRENINGRMLSKVYGIRTVFSLQGQAGKFDLASLTITLGAGLGLLGVSKFICDFCLEHILPQKEEYVNQKYISVNNSEINMNEQTYGSSNRNRNMTM